MQRIKASASNGYPQSRCLDISQAASLDRDRHSGRGRRDTVHGHFVVAAPDTIMARSRRFVRLAVVRALTRECRFH